MARVSTSEQGEWSDPHLARFAIEASLLTLLALDV